MFNFPRVSCWTCFPFWRRNSSPLPSRFFGFSPLFLLPFLGWGLGACKVQIMRILQNIICLFEEMEFQPEAQQTHVPFSSCSPPSPHELGTDPVQREHVDIFFLKRGVATFWCSTLSSVCFYNFQTFWCSTLSSVCLSILASGTHSSQFLFHPL